jgi:hypothetical protein
MQSEILKKAMNIMKVNDNSRMILKSLALAFGFCFSYSINSMAQIQPNAAYSAAVNFLLFQEEDPAFINEKLSPEGWLPDRTRNIGDKIPISWTLENETTPEGWVNVEEVDELSYYPLGSGPLIVYRMFDKNALTNFNYIHNEVKSKMTLIHKETIDDIVTYYIYGNSTQVVQLMEGLREYQGVERKFAANVYPRVAYDSGYRAQF